MGDIYFLCKKEVKTRMLLLPQCSIQVVILRRSQDMLQVSISGNQVGSYIQ